MYISNITINYDNNTSSSSTDNNNMTLSKCTNNENNTDIIIPTILLTMPCGPSFLCLMSLMVYTIMKPLK